MGASPHHPSHHHRLHLHLHHKFLNQKLIVRALYCLIPLALIHLYLFPLPFNKNTPSPLPASQTPHVPILVQTTTSTTIPSTTQSPETLVSNDDEETTTSQQPTCNYFDGHWVPADTSRAPLYNSTSCTTIKDGQNCIAHGRPDTNYLNWRWQPYKCNLPAFDPTTFLRLMRNKHIAFVGDSLARNQLESLLCLLSSSASSELVFANGEDNKFRRWAFPAYNATVSVFWSPFLVRGDEKSPAEGINHNTLYLDSPDEKWASETEKIDIMIFSVGHWFLHPAIYREGDVTLGCHSCPEFNFTEIGFFDVFRKAVRTTLGTVLERTQGSSSVKNVVLTTFSPAHFQGEWDDPKACSETEPFKEGEKEMEYMDALMRRIEVEEVAKAVEKTKAMAKKTVRIQALDVTRLALMRPDGHPGPYMHANPFADGPKDRVQNDCVHWCLPGPIDVWNEILLAMIQI